MAGVNLLLDKFDKTIIEMRAHNSLARCTSVGNSGHSA